MAWHNHGHRIRSASTSYCANRRWATNRSCHLAVGPSGAVGDAPKLFPNAPLESGCLHVCGQIEMGFPPAQVCEDFPNPLAKLTPARWLVHTFRSRIFLPKRSAQSRIRAAQIERANASIGCADEQAPQR